MKRFAALLLVAALFVPVETSWSASSMMSVQVRTGELRDSPSFLGSPVAQVHYGESVEVLQEQGAWTEVRAPSGEKGWLHQSALATKHVLFSTGAEDVKMPASNEELALASKGFDSDIEAVFRKSHVDVDFTWVDRMEQMTVTPRELVVFLKQGGLQLPAGGAK